MIEYGWPRPAPRTLAERIAGMTEAARHLHGDLLDLAADLDAAEAEVKPAPSPDATHSAPRPIDPDDVRVGDRVRAVTTWDGVITEMHHDALYMRQDDGGCAYIDPEEDETVLYLLERPDPDAALHAAIEAAWDATDVFDAATFVAALAAAGYVIEARHQHRVDAEGDWAYPGITTYHIEAMAERAARADDALRDGEWPAGFPDADAYRTITRAALAALRETHTIEPKATTGGLRA